MLLTTIIGLITALIQSVMMFLVGKILCHPIELRQFLNSNNNEDDLLNFQNIVIWIEYLGQIVKIYAVVYAIIALIVSPLRFFF